MFWPTHSAMKFRSNTSQQAVLGPVSAILIIAESTLHKSSSKDVKGFTKAHFATFLGWRRIDDQSCVTNSIDQTQRPASKWDMGRSTKDFWSSKCHELWHDLSWLTNLPLLNTSDGKRWKTHMQDVLTAEQVVDIVIVTDCHGEPCAAHTFPTSSTCGPCQQGTIHHLDPQNSRSSPGSRT